MSAADQWRWTDDEGVQRLLRGDELRAALADGRLKPTTLVWKRGMHSWVPAAEVAELHDAFDGPDTLTAQRPPDLGRKASPSPSVPPPAPGARPQNIVNISALQGDSRAPINTLVGVGDARARAAGAAADPKIPSAPKVPVVDGGWQEGAARRDSDEQTITRLRAEEEVATLSEAEKLRAERREAADAKPAARPAAQQQRRKGSRPPPPPNRARRSKPAPPPVAETRVSAGQEAGHKPGRSVPPVRSNAVLSEAFDRPGSSRKRLPAGPAAPSSGGEPRVRTAPLPEMRPDNQSRPGNPRFANEPWELPGQGPAAAVEPASQGAPRQAVIPTDVRRQAAVRADLLARGGSGFLIKFPVAVGGGVGVMALLVLSFFIGRLLPAQSDSAGVVKARSGWAAVPLFARTRATQPAEPRPCLMIRAPARFASAASHRIPLELAVAAGDELAVGFARSARQARGMLVNPVAGTAKKLFDPQEEEEEDLSRVVPLVSGKDVEFGTTLIEHGPIKNAVFVASGTPFVVGFDESNLVRLAKPTSKAAPLWSLEPASGKGDALTAAVVQGKGVALAYRYKRQIVHGMLKSDGAVWKAAGVVDGSGGKVGKPAVAANAGVVSVVFADKPNGSDARAEIRWARGPIGTSLKAAALVELPPGGPGGDAIAPSIAALSGNRWLLMWTEGKRGARTLRAQTYDHSYQPIGEALRVSPATGSFGAGTVGVVGENAIVLFLLATSQGYQIWGTVLQCK